MVCCKTNEAIHASINQSEHLRSAVVAILERGSVELESQRMTKVS